MNSLVILSLALVVAVSFIEYGDAAVSEAIIKGMQANCKKQAGVADDVFNNALKGKIDFNDHKLQCYTKCMFEAGHVMQPDGKLKMQVYVNGMTDERKKLIGASSLLCEKEAADDKDLCKKSMNMYQCLQKHQKEHFRFV